LLQLGLVQGKHFFKQQSSS